VSSNDDRVAVVTGGGRGIGRGIVAELAAIGFSVVVNYRSDLEAARSTCRLAEERGAPRTVAFRADVADPSEGGRLVQETLEQFGHVDLWVNNAGVAPEHRVDMLETSAESWDRVLGTNLRGPFLLTQAVARAMLERDSTRDPQPQIVFISSISSTFASVNRPEYCVAKAGLSMVAQLFALRLAGQGIRVYEIRPGLIETDKTRPVHDAYSERIASGAFPFSTGEVIHVDGGLGLRSL